MKKLFVTLIALILCMMFYSCAHADEKELFIKAINPGYLVDGVSNVGEMIEIGRKKSDEPFLLTGFSIGYTNSSGKYTTLFEFPENSWMTGENLLLRFASSPGHELANLTYNKTLAMKAGPLEIKNGEEVVDSVCWNNKEGCVAEFKASEPTFLVRNEDGEFEHTNSYEPVYDPSAYFVEEEEAVLPSQCKGLVFSEVLT